MYQVFDINMESEGLFNTYEEALQEIATKRNISVEEAETIVKDICSGVRRARIVHIPDENKVILTSYLWGEETVTEKIVKDHKEAIKMANSFVNDNREKYNSENGYSMGGTTSHSTIDFGYKIWCYQSKFDNSFMAEVKPIYKN